MVDLGQVPPLAAFPPVVSPDGRSVAGLASWSDDAVYIDAHVSGRNLSSLYLWFRAAEPGTALHVFPAAEVAWAAWSSHGPRLLAIVYEFGRPFVLMMTPPQGALRRTAAGFAHMLTPAVSPDGQRLAVAVYDQLPGDARVAVISLDRLATHLAPNTGTPQILPQWLDNTTLVYHQQSADAAGMIRGQLAGDTAYPIAAVAPAADLYETIEAQLNIVAPFNPSGTRFCWREAGSDRLVCIDVADGERWPLPADAIAACGVTDDVLMLTTDGALRLYDVATGRSTLLWTGPGLPRWTSARRGTFHFCAADGADGLRLNRGSVAMPR